MLDSLIIGGGPAGLAAAQEMLEQGLTNILVVERDMELGGILNQCIHNGFGLHTFREELTGPEYAQRYIDKINELKVPYQLNSMVLEIEAEGPIKKVHVVSKEYGYQILETKTVVLAMGSRERTRFMIQIPGTRPAGIYMAGTAQRLVNIEGHPVGKEVVILGSGDIGLIMARRMTLDGANVKMVLELEPHSNGLNRNIVQCLDDYDIPLKLSHTVVNIHGKDRLEGVSIAQVDKNRRPIEGTIEYVPCDTLLLSVGLIPENELSTTANVKLDRKTRGPLVNDMMETNVEGVFAAGNVVHIHDLVDNVSSEAVKAATNVVKYLNQSKQEYKEIPIVAGDFVSYTVPQTYYVNPDNTENLEIMFRVTKMDKNVKIIVKDEKDQVLRELRRAVIAPGEMEKIKLTRKLVNDVQGQLSISIGEI
ncbi:MAG: NAD(P)/FAD-dependent oxidoreductase [Erysipelothrix sp.]|nr:NAD(P)/FAD-dependent oxidoreductase [Erysipelothrix sp.]